MLPGAVGVRSDGHKELVAVGDGFRETIESWSELPRDLKRRGMRAPVVAISDGAPSWGTLRDIFPEGREQRCWVHKSPTSWVRYPTAYSQR